MVVDREMRALTDVLINALSDPQAHPRQIVERTALALLTYVEENAEGFRVLTRDSPKTDPSNSFNSLLGDIAVRVEDILTDAFKRQHLPAKSVPYYAQMLIGMTVYTCQYWADQRKLSKEQLAAHIVNLAFVERFVRSHDHDGCGRKSQIQQVESFAVGVGGGEPLGADRHSRLVAHDHEHAILGLDVGELVEHRLHSPVIQEL